MVSVVLTAANPYVQNSTIVLVTVCVWRPSSVNVTWDTMARTAVTTLVKQLITVQVTAPVLDMMFASVTFPGREQRVTFQIAAL